MAYKIFTYPTIIKETDLDLFGHVNNAVYLRLFEDARWDLLHKNHFGVKKILETKLGPTILEIHLRYLKELRARDEVVIATQTISYERKIGRIRQTILRRDEECCVADLVVGLFSLTERKLVLPTDEWIKAITE